MRYSWNNILLNVNYNWKIKIKKINGVYDTIYICYNDSHQKFNHFKKTIKVQRNGIGRNAIWPLILSSLTVSETDIYDSNNKIPCNSHFFHYIIIEQLAL